MSTPGDWKGDLHSPVWQQDDHVGSLRLRDGAARVAPEPAERTAKSASATAADQKAFVTHEQPHGGEGLLVRGLHPFGNVRRVAGQHVWDEVVANAFDNVGIASAFCVELVGIRQNAPFLIEG